MSKKIAIVTDSTGCIPQQVAAEYGIDISHIMIIFKDQAYQEFKEISPEKFVELLGTQAELPSTSQPSPGLTVELYEEILGRGFDHIIHITISSKLSGTYQSAVNCAEMVDASKITVFDSLSVAFPQGALAIEAAKMVRNGASVEEILSQLEELRKTTHVSAAILKLDNLKKGGRLSNAQAALGSLLNIKPIIQVQPEGNVEAIDKVRTFKKAIAALAAQVKDAKLDESYEIGVLHIENEEDAKKLMEEVAAVYPNNKIHLLPLSLVLSVHTGPGAVAMTWIKTL